MNRFVKQNLLLITVMGISGVVILALLVYSGIVYFQNGIAAALFERNYHAAMVSEFQCVFNQIGKHPLNHRPVSVEQDRHVRTMNF